MQGTWQRETPPWDSQHNATCHRAEVIAVYPAKTVHRKNTFAVRTAIMPSLYPVRPRSAVRPFKSKRRIFLALHRVLSLLLIAAIPGYCLAQGARSELIADTARQSALRIEGATQGSGVIVEYTQNVYTALTAWHVVADQKPGEVFIVYTADGKPHAMEASEITRIGTSDMAYFRFVDLNKFPVARLRDAEALQIGTRTYVTGYSKPSASVPTSIFRFTSGMLVANIEGQSLDGYTLIYDNPTVGGMSGGGVYDDNGLLIGIHGREESTESRGGESSKTEGTRNKLGMPIILYQNISPVRRAIPPQPTNEPTSSSKANSQEEQPKGEKIDRGDSLEKIPGTGFEIQGSPPSAKSEQDSKNPSPSSSNKNSYPSEVTSPPSGNRFSELIDKNRSLPRDIRKGSFREP